MYIVKKYDSSSCLNTIKYLKFPSTFYYYKHYNKYYIFLFYFIFIYITNILNSK